MRKRPIAVVLLWGLGGFVAVAAAETLGVRHLASSWGALALWSSLSLTVGLMLIAPVRAWWPIAGATLLASIIAQRAGPHQVSLAQTAASALGGPLTALLSSWLLVRLCQGRPQLARPNHVALILSIGGIAAAIVHGWITTAIGEAMFGTSAANSAWIIASIRTAVCNVIVIPVVIAIAEVLEQPLGRHPRQALVRLLLPTATAVATIWVFSGRPADWRAFALLLLPLSGVILAAFISGPRLAAVNSLIMGIGAVGLTGAGRGPLAALVPVRDAIVGGDLFVICTTVLGALTAAAVAERARLTAEVNCIRERLELAVRGSHVGIWDWDILRDHCDWSGAAGAGRGQAWPADQGGWENALHPDDRARVRAALDQHVSAGKPYGIDYRLRVSTGGYRWFRSSGEAIRDASGKAVRMVGTVVDVTEQVEAAARLAESEQRFRLITEISSDFIAQFDMTGRRLYRSPSLYRTFHFTREELERTDSSLRVHPDDHHLTAEAHEAIRHGEPRRVQFRAIKPDGSFIWLDMRIEPLLDGQGTQTGYVSYSRDITELKHIQDQLHTAEERYRAFITQSAEAIWRFDHDAPVDLSLPEDQLMTVMMKHTFLAECNDAMASMYGFERADELIGARLGTLMPPEDPRTQEFLRAFIRAGFRLNDHETHEVDRHGAPRTFINNMVGVIRDGRLTHVWGMQRDVTARRAAELALADAEAQLRALFELAAVGMAQVTLDGRFVLVNPGLCRIFGRSAAELTAGLTFLDVTHPDDWAENARIRREALESGTDRYDMRKRYIRADGTVIWAELAATIVRDAAGIPLYQISVVTDITERMRTEAALAATAKQYRRLVEGLNVIAWEGDAQSFAFTFVTGAVRETLGYEPEEWLKPDFWLSIVHPDDAEAAKAYCLSKTQEGLDHDFEYRAIHKDGHTVWIRDLVSVSRDEDDRLRLRGVLIDITQQKLAEQARRDSEARFLRITETIEQVFWVLDFSAGRLLYLSPSFERVWGRPAADMADGVERFWSSLHPEDRDRVRKETIAARDERRAFDITYRIVRPDGSLRWIRDRGRADAGPDGKSIIESGIAEDITSQREAEEALRVSERTNRAILAAMPDFMFIIDAHGRYIGYHALDEANLLVPPHEFIGRTAAEVLPPNLARLHDDHVARLRETGHPQTYEYRIARRNEVRWWEVRMVLREDGFVMSLVRNITERKRAEHALADSQRRLAALISQAPIGIIVWNTRFEIMQWNPAAERIFGHSVADTIGRHGSLIVPPEARPVVDEVWRSLLARRGGNHSINDNITRAGVRITCEWHNTQLTAADGTVIGVSSFVQDVTERVVAERRQNLMMQELDHRVKNNMAAVLSLAEQTGRSTSTLDEFQSTFSGRVRALARMHNVLATNRWRDADLTALVLQTVTPYSGESPKRLAVDGPTVAIPARPAQSLAMTLNELATNAAKHGALSTSAGHVSIDWTLLPASHAGESSEATTPPILRVTWLERAGPPTTTPSRRGLGMDLIEGAIIYQLGGEVTFNFGSEGLECTLVVPLRDDDSPLAHPASDNRP